MFRSPRRGLGVAGLLLGALFTFSALASPSTAAISLAAVSTSEPSPPPPQADSWVGTLHPGELLRDQAAGGNTLIHQHDGNVVVYNVDGRALWSSRTAGKATSRLVMQHDGNLVLYDAANQPIFQTKTAGTGATLTLQGDANAVLYAPEPHVKWAARHWPPKPPTPQGGSPAQNRALGQHMLTQKGWGHQFSCLDRLWSHESGWSQYADNPDSSAYGIPQATPGSKMGSHGADWRTNPRTQIAWGLDYIFGRYGSPCAADSHSKRYGWY